ncbi:MAG TPA: aminomethyl-transferring glycine dehydrogenase subunit GcvPA [Actinomycetota bacterium]|nr:aminomethyl-transferring glycine dehydrogenase subunit GcvPA [Actinomycetota bacterium]
MEFAPHTDADVRMMLDALGLASVDDLFAPIPSSLRYERPLDMPEGHTEIEVLRELGALAARNRSTDELVCFLGAGAYDHHVPSMVWPLLSRGEFATSYTPYQPEVSQGVLQALFEYQTMISELTGLEISNASLYDGGSALGEAVHMAASATGRKAVVLAGCINPLYAAVLRTVARGPDFELREARWGSNGTADLDAIRALADGAAAVAIQTPSFLGTLEDVAAIADVTHAAGAKLIVHFDLTSAGILEAPGVLGADIVVAEGQPLGNHLNFGGPYVGVIACRREEARRLPGRLVGETTDREGRRAFVLTLQAREQHIRRAKATSNICTNQTLNALGTSMALAWLGPEGLRELGETCLAKARYCRDRLVEVAGAKPAFDAPAFKEFAVRLAADPVRVCERAAADGYLAGLPLAEHLPGRGLDDALLIAVTERRTREEIDGLAESIARACKEEA